MQTFQNNLPYAVMLSHQVNNLKSHYGSENVRLAIQERLVLGYDEKHEGYHLTTIINSMAEHYGINVLRNVYDLHYNNKGEAI